MKRYPAPRGAWVVMPGAYGPAEYLERIGYSVAEVRAAWSKRYQRIKCAKCSRDIYAIHAETIRNTAAMRPISDMNRTVRPITETVCDRPQDEREGRA